MSSKQQKLLSNLQQYFQKDFRRRSPGFLGKFFGRIVRVGRQTATERKPANIINVVGTQCNIYIAQRLRRLQKIYLVYQQAYNDYARMLLFYPIIRRLAIKRPLALVLAACGFQWQEEGISDADIHQQIKDLMMMQQAVGHDIAIESTASTLPSFWQNVMNEPEIKMWKYRRADLGLTEYKVHGTFRDISAKMFFNIQVDMDYRKKWDDLVVKLDVVDENRAGDEQVLQWVTRLPYPFAPREYLCIRRTLIDEKNKVMVISAKAVSQHPSCPPSKNYVRVNSYVSHMVIKPHKSFDDLGFDYLMTYCDDPQIVIPTRLSSWVISAGVPEYINKLHNACLSCRNMTTTVRNRSGGPLSYLLQDS